MNQTRSTNKTDGKVQSECKSKTGFTSVVRQKKCVTTSDNAVVKPQATTKSNIDLKSPNIYESLLTLETNDNETSGMSNSFGESDCTHQ